MGKQVRFYLTPTDSERLLNELQDRFAVRVIQLEAPTMAPVEAPAPLWPGQQQLFLIDVSANVRLRFYPKREIWLVQVESEVIEFTRCTFVGQTLQQGRFYFQTDFLAGDQILRKRPAFLSLGDKLLRYVKHALRRDPDLSAYVGQDADEFRRLGGSFSPF